MQKKSTFLKVWNVVSILAAVYLMGDAIFCAVNSEWAKASFMMIAAEIIFVQRTLNQDINS